MHETTVQSSVLVEKTTFQELSWVKELRQDLQLSNHFIDQLENLVVEWQAGGPDVYVRDLAKFSDRIHLTYSAIQAKLRMRGFDVSDFLADMPSETRENMEKRRAVSFWVEKIAKKIFLYLRYPDEEEVQGILPVSLGNTHEFCIMEFLPGATRSKSMVVKEPGPNGKKWFVKTTLKKYLLPELTVAQKLKAAGATKFQAPTFFINIPPETNQIISEQTSVNLTDAGKAYDTYEFFEYLDSSEWQSLVRRIVPGKNYRPALTKAQRAQFVREFAAEQLGTAKNGYMLADRMVKNIMIKVDESGKIDWRNVDLGMTAWPKDDSVEEKKRLEHIAVRQTFTVFWYVLLADFFTDIRTIGDIHELTLSIRAVDPLDALEMCLSKEGSLNNEARRKELTDRLYARLLNCEVNLLTDIHRQQASAICHELRQIVGEFNWYAENNNPPADIADRTLQKLLALL